MIEISQSAREAVQALRDAGLTTTGLTTYMVGYRRAEEITQLAIERETKSLRDQLALAEEDAWKYRLLGR